MSDVPTPTIYTNFWLYNIDREFRRLPAEDRNSITAAFVDIIESADQVTLRSAYSTVGLRHDVDLIIWVVTDDLDAMQQLAAEINRSELGYYLDCRYSYLGIAAGSRYTADHAPAFISGVPTKRYLSVYPFVKSHDWYQVPFEERRTIMAEHGRMGREYPDILTNTVSSYGIADHEFVVALESDDIEDMVKMVEHLRRAESRPYTVYDTPIFLGVSKSLEQVLADIG